MAEPALPPELERQIFEIAAHTCPFSIPDMMRVAWRVKHWIEPILYHTLIFYMNPPEGFHRCTIDIFRHIARTKPEFFLRNSVRKVVVRYMGDDLGDILTECPDIESLDIVGTLTNCPSLPRGFGALRLNERRCDLNEFVDFDRITPRPLAIPPFRTCHPSITA
ncbi:hypothetical protein DFH06DRAFT_346612 [Mycena polygramma]|nr:hypothetical protein DFH06DRAFT_346581 [Mycena polygramma]KAJ7663253.1 hypothetical protein DFH06DRAFT_346612 [Mycena polygramma]